MFKIKIVGEVSTEGAVWLVAVRKDVEAGSYDVVLTVINRVNPRPNFRRDGEERKVYDTYAEALNAARKITAGLEGATAGV